MRHLNVLPRVIAAREELAAGNTLAAAYILEDLEHDLEEDARRWVCLDDFNDIPDMSV